MVAQDILELAETAVQERGGEKKLADQVRQLQAQINKRQNLLEKTQRLSHANPQEVQSLTGSIQTIPKREFKKQQSVQVDNLRKQVAELQGQLKDSQAVLDDLRQARELSESAKQGQMSPDLPEQRKVQTGTRVEFEASSPKTTAKGSIQDGFVTGSKGTPDLAYLSDEIAKKTGLPKTLRMEEGVPGPDGYGFLHIQGAKDKLKRIKKAGFINKDGSADIIGYSEYVGQNVNKVIDEKNGKYMLVVEPDQYIEVVKPAQKKGEKFTGIITGYPNRASSIEKGIEEKGWEIVWEGRNPASTRSGSLGAPGNALTAKETGQIKAGARGQAISKSKNSISTTTPQPSERVNTPPSKQNLEAALQKYQAQKGKVGAKKAARDVYELAGEMDRKEFTDTLKSKLSKEELDNLGKELGKKDGCC